MRRSIRERSLSALAVLFAGVGIGCAGEQYPQTTFRPVTDYGEALNLVFYNTFWWTMGIMTIVFLLIGYVVFRFRERPDQPRPRQIHGNTKLEIMWTIVPALIVVAIAVPTVQTIFDTQARAPEDALEIEVIGHQWWWEFRYPALGVVTANHFYVPTGQPIHLRLTSADVIHSFWMPRFGGKRDVNPQPRTAEAENPRPNHLLFTVQEPGVYRGQCAEYCGTSHAIMAISAVAVAPAEFAAWVETMRDVPASPPAAPPGAPADTAAPAAATTTGALQQPTPPGAAGAQAATPRAAQGPQAEPAAAAQSSDPLIEQGRQVFLSKPCIVCHAIAGTSARGVMGPNLTRFADRPTIGAGALANNVGNLIAWITDPRAIKPGALMPGIQSGAPAPSAPNGPPFPATGLTAEEVRAVAAYLSSLR